MTSYNIIVYSSYPIVRVALEQIIKKNIIHSNVIHINSIDQFIKSELKNIFDLLLIDTMYETDINLIYSTMNALKKEQKVLFLTENYSIKKNKNSLNFIYLDKASDEKKIITCLQSFFDLKKNYNVVTKTIKKHNVLSKRETECAILLMKGYSINEISKKLSLALTTVSTYKTRILKKTRTKNLVELTKSLYNLENAS